MTDVDRRRQGHEQALERLAVADGHVVARRTAEARRALHDALAAAVGALELVPEAQRDDDERSFVAHLLRRWADLGVAGPDEPIASVVRAMPLVDDLLDGPTRGGVRQLLALARTLRGEGSTAELLAAAEAAVVAAELDPFRSAEAEAYLASHLEWMGDVEASEAHLANAARHLDALTDDTPGDVPELRRFVRQIAAQVAFTAGRFEEAARAFEALAPEYGNDGVALVATAASAYVEAGLLDRARKALDGIAGTPRGRWSADILGIEGELLLGAGDHETADRAFDEAFVALGTEPNVELRWQLLHGRARILAAEGDPTALAVYREAVDTVLSTRRAPLGYERDSRWLAGKRPLFDRAIAWAVEVGAHEACGELVERVKAASLSAVLSLPRGRAAAADDELAAVSDAIDAIDLANSRGTNSSEVLDARRDELLGRRQRLIDQRRRDDPRWALLTRAPRLETEALPDTLRRRGQAVLSLHLTPDEVITVVADGDGFASGKVPRTAATDGPIARYATNLTAPRPVAGAFDPARLGIDVSQLVPPALIARALDAQTVVVAPSGILHLLPWPALLHEDRRLFEHRPIGVLPNVTSLLLLDAPATPPSGVTAFANGPHLPGVRAEIREVVDLYGQAAVAITNGDAHQARLLQELAAVDGAVLHVACHGRADERWPMASGLEASDHLVDANDILVRGVGRREVVLSACSTGWRPFQVGDLQLLGDDVLGLPGALLEGGASSVLVSIPPAEDEPMRRLCIAYHRERRSGRSPLHAFAAAQRERAATGDPAWGWVGTVLYSGW